jgi:hypothetical protein
MKVSIPALVLIVGVLIQCGGPTQKAPAGLSTQQKTEIQAALQAKGFPSPKSLEVNETGWLVAIFELADPRSAAYLENFATDTVLLIRNTLYPSSAFSKYRVTLDGPSPGPGLVLRYGSARFIEGDKVVWEPTKK